MQSSPGILSSFLRSKLMIDIFPCEVFVSLSISWVGMFSTKRMGLSLDLLCIRLVCLKIKYSVIRMYYLLCIIQNTYMSIHDFRVLSYLHNSHLRSVCLTIFTFLLTSWCVCIFSCFCSEAIHTQSLPQVAQPTLFLCFASIMFCFFVCICNNMVLAVQRIYTN